MKFLAWLDLETTGLDAYRGKIMELGLVITDIHLNEKARFHRVIGLNEKTLAPLCDDVVVKMHKESGLWNECMQSIHITGIVENEVCDLIAKTCGEVPYDIALAGSTIRFDRSFLEAHMPDVLKRVHYRMIDTSGLRYAMMPVTGIDFELKKSKAHRAMPDIDESISEFRFLWRSFFQWQQRGGLPLLDIGLGAEKEERR